MYLKEEPLFVIENLLGDKISTSFQKGSWRWIVLQIKWSFANGYAVYQIIVSIGDK